MRNLLVLGVWIGAVLCSQPATAAVIAVPADYPSVQAGLDTAAAGDTVLVTPGTYLENLLWPETDNVLLKGAEGHALTVVDGDAQGRVLEYTSAATITLRLEGVAFVNGRSVNGAGLRIDNATVEMISCRVQGNNATEGAGGGALFSQVQFSIQDCAFLANSADNWEIYSEGGGGLLVMGNGAVQRCLFQDNGLTNGQGSGVSVRSGSVQIDGCTFFGNTCQESD